MILFHINFLLTFYLTRGEFFKYRNLEIDLQFVENDGCCSKYTLTYGKGFTNPSLTSVFGLFVRSIFPFSRVSRIDWYENFQKKNRSKSQSKGTFV